jgi:hypothetical protein
MVERTDGLVLGTVNAPYKRGITGDQLVAAIRDPQENLDWIVHLTTLFTDVRPALIFGFAERHLIDAGQLRRAYGYVKRKTGERNPEFEREARIED